MDEQKLDVTAQQPDAALHAQTAEITNEALPEALLEQQAAQAELSQAIEASAEELQPEQAEQTTQPERVTVVDIRFRNNAKTYFFDPGELRPVSGDHVIIETARGDEYGICAGACHEVKASEIVPPLRKVLRMATAQDERINRDNQEKEKRAFEVCQQKIADAQARDAAGFRRGCVRRQQDPFLLHRRGARGFPRAGQGPRLCVPHAH